MATPHAPAFTPGPAQQQRGNGIAVAGMVLGLVGILLCWANFLGMIPSVLGIIFGAIGWSKANKVGRGKGMAIAGVVCGVVGLILAIVFIMVVMASFTSYMKKSKSTEATLQLRNLQRAIDMHQLEYGTLPPSAEAVLPGPDGGACANQQTGKMPAVPQSVWDADPGWKALRFHIDEPSMYSYHWTRVSATEGYALAVTDLDCDGMMSTTRLDITVTEGRLKATFGEPSQD
jgi:type II secretory pathway pseudopilin PulG